MRYFVILAMLIVLSFVVYSQEHDHKRESEHLHPEVEIGVSNGIVYNFTEKEAAYGIHVHVVKTINKSDKFGLGFGYEAIFDDHRHNAVSFIIAYRPVDQFSFNFSPGISWLSTENDSAKPSLHLEALYEWELGIFHVGPLVGVASNFEDFHGSVGLHLAIGF
jgi:hypothetical protein